MVYQYLEMTQSCRKGRSSFLFLENDHFVLADASFRGEEISTNFIQRFDLRHPLRSENLHKGCKEITDKLQSLGTLSRNIVVALPPALCTVSVLTVPKTKGLYLNVLIENKLDKSDGPVTYKYRILNEHGTGQNQKLSILVCSAPSSVVNNLYLQVESAGYRVKFISHPVIGIMEVLNRGYLSDQSELVLFIDRTTEPIALYVFKDGSPEHVRVLKNLGQSEVGEFVDGLTIETKRTYDFCKQRYNGRSFGQIIYSGRLEKSILDYCANISTTLNCDTKVIRINNTSIESQRGSGTEFLHFLPSMCGLYVQSRSVANLVSKKSFNFCSTQHNSKLIVTVLLAALIAMSCFVYQFTCEIKDKVERLAVDLEQINSEIKKLSSIKELDEEISSLQSYYDEIAGIMMGIQRPSFALAEPTLVVIDNVPPTSYITSINMKRDMGSTRESRVLTVRIKDNFKGNSSHSLENTLRRLKQSGYFTDIDYTLIETGSGSDNEQSLEEALLRLEL